MSNRRRNKRAGALALLLCGTAAADTSIDPRDFCPPGFELTDGNRCVLRSLSDNDDSFEIAIFDNVMRNNGTC